MRKFTIEKFVEDQAQSKNLVILEIKEGIAEIVTKHPNNINIITIDFDELPNCHCPICSGDTTTIKIDGEYKEYCLDCDFWFD